MIPGQDLDSSFVLVDGPSGSSHNALKKTQERDGTTRNPTNAKSGLQSEVGTKVPNPTHNRSYITSLTGSPFPPPRFYSPLDIRLCCLLTNPAALSRTLTNGLEVKPAFRGGILLTIMGVFVS